MAIRICSLFPLLFFYSIISNAQSAINLHYLRGYTFPHNDNVINLESHPHIIKIDYAFQPEIKKYQTVLGYPKAGISLDLIDHDNKYTGRSVAFSAYFQL